MTETNININVLESQFEAEVARRRSASAFIVSIAMITGKRNTPIPKTLPTTSPTNNTLSIRHDSLRNFRKTSNSLIPAKKVFEEEVNPNTLTEQELDRIYNDGDREDPFEFVREEELEEE